MTSGKTNSQFILNLKNSNLFISILLTIIFIITWVLLLGFGSPVALLSGYISKENTELLKKSVPFKIKRYGSGKIFLFSDNTNFRAFWYGTNRLLMNSVYLSNKM